MNNDDPFSLNFPRSHSQVSTNSVLCGSSCPTIVYRRRARRNSVGACLGQTSTNTRITDGCHSVISSEANSVATKKHIESEVVVEKKAIDVLPDRQDLCSEETLRTDNRRALETSCLNDSCSSSKSNFDLDPAPLKAGTEDLGECSSSGALAAERLQDEMSERAICISLLGKERLTEKAPLSSCASAGGAGAISDNCRTKSCIVCKHPENTSKMIVCDNCEDAFHVSCSNPHLKEIPENEWFCEPCMQRKDKVLKEKSSVRDAGGALPASQGNVGIDFTSAHGSQGDVPRDSTSEMDSKGTARRDSTSEYESQGNASRDITSEDESQGDASRDSTSEDESQGDASRDSTSEDESQGDADKDSTSDDGTGPISLMLKDSEPFTSNVRIGSQFQAEVPAWSGPIIDEIGPLWEPLEISEADSLLDSKCKRAPRNSSIGNWLQCREVIEGAGAEDDETICGKWRRAPLFEVQTDNFECFRCVLWDPYHADCAVPQELETDEVLKQLKYIEMLRPRLAAKRRKLDRSKTGVAQGSTGASEK